VRFIGNRSSGRMGFAVAEALAAAGARVVLVAGPVQRPTPAGVERIDVRTAEQMRRAVLDSLPADGFVGVAAVADYRPAESAEQKIKRSGDAIRIDLVPNPDIVGEVAASSPRPFVVGFAAETERVDDNARDKLVRRGLDLIAANRVGDDAGFDTCDNALVVHSADRRRELGTASKTVLARRLVEIIAEHMKGTTA
jgi:phosphopantothenoylcysteine decarboxylase/phosphopantothenate--cysteine ligase